MRATGEIEKAIQCTKAKTSVKEKEMELRSQERIKKMELEYALRIEELKMRVSMNPVPLTAGYGPSQPWNTNQQIAGPSDSTAPSPYSLMDDLNDAAQIGDMEWDRR